MKTKTPEPKPTNLFEQIMYANKRLREFIFWGMLITWAIKILIYGWGLVPEEAINDNEGRLIWCVGALANSWWYLTIFGLVGWVSYGIHLLFKHFD